MYAIIKNISHIYSFSIRTAILAYMERMVRFHWSI